MTQTSLWKNTSDSKKKKLEEKVEHLIGKLPAIVLDDISDAAFLREPTTLGDRLSMVYTRDGGEALFTSHAWRKVFEVRAPLLGEARRRMTWRQFILALGLHFEEEMAEPGFGAYWSGSERGLLGPAPSYVHIRDPVRRLCHRMIACSISGRGQGAKKVTGVDLFYLRSMDRGTANVPYLLAQYLFHHAEGRKSGAWLSRGELPVIDLHELARLNICARFSDTWAWVAPGPEWQQAATAGALGAAEDALAVDKGSQAILVPVQAPQLPPQAPQPQSMS
ncbi:hypothetical protein Tco_0873234 [Tanacetum coccineum]